MAKFSKKQQILGLIYARLYKIETSITDGTIKLGLPKFRNSINRERVKTWMTDSENWNHSIKRLIFLLSSQILAQLSTIERYAYGFVERLEKNYKENLIQVINLTPNFKVVSAYNRKNLRR